MIAELKPYAEYKESGAPWFGDVPGHWDVKRLGSVFAERSETNEKYEVTEVLSVLKDIGVIPYSEKGRIGNKKSEDIGRYKIVRPDDLVVNCMNVIIGSVGRSRYTGCLSPVYYVLKRRKSENLPRYLELVFQHKSFQRSLVRIGNGILAHRMRIPMEKLKAELFPLPPPPEQAAIVRFLDWANGRLERAIRAKRKVIALLNEQKQAIIHRAVTRGLDPSVPLKPSGIPWLGDIPQHWEAIPMRQLLLFGPKNGISPPTSTTGGILSFSISAVRDGRIRVAGNEKYVSLDPSLVPAHSIRSGDILLVRGNGNVALVAKCGLVDECPDNCTYPDILMKLRPNSRMLADFMVLAVNSWYVGNQVPRLAKSTNGIFKVSGASVRLLVLAVPPCTEQERILQYLSHAFAEVNRAIKQADQEVSLLREYRTRLVADVVTGKLDVREAAARLPDEAAPDIAEDDTDPSIDPEAAEADAAV